MNRQGKIRLRKKQKNPRSKAAKLSHYRLLKVVECFAADLTIKQTYARTKVSERSLREIYAQLRQRMFEAVLYDPRIFNGINALLTDTKGRLEVEVLAFMAAYSKTGEFKAWMKARYPRTNVDKQPMLHFVMEFFIRRYLTTEPPKVTEEFRDNVARNHFAAHMLVSTLAHKPGDRPAKIRAFWSFARAGINVRRGHRIRRYGSLSYHRLYQELRGMLLTKPLGTL